MLQAYFDESERENRLLCVAGYVFAPQHARQLKREFDKAFGQYGGFHMKDLVARRRGFKGISEEDQHRLIRVAVDSVKSHFRYGVAATISIAEYDLIAPKWIRGFKNAYPFLCHLAMTAVATIVRAHGENGPIAYVFEAGHAHEAEARHAVRQMSQSQELRDYYMHHSDSFLPKPDAVPLQAADLLAWETCKFKHETIDGEREIRKSLLALFEVDTSRYKISFHGGPTLKRAMEKYHALALEQYYEEEEWRKQRQHQRNSRSSAQACAKSSEPIQS